MFLKSRVSNSSLRRAVVTLGSAILLVFNAGCKKSAQDNFVHVDVFGQAGARYYPILDARFRRFSRGHAALPTGRKIMASAVMEEDFAYRLADPSYRSQAQVIVLSSEQEAQADPSFAAEFAQARKACSEQIPCFLLVPASVTGEQRQAAEQLVDYVVAQTAKPSPVQDGVGANPGSATPASETSTPAPPAETEPTPPPPAR